MRLFAGIPLSSDLRDRTARILGPCVRVNPDIRWVRPEQLHWTLRFFGEVAQGLLASLKNALGRVACKQGTFSLEMGGLEVFSKFDRPRILYVPALRGAEDLRNLAGVVAFETTNFGFPEPEEEYHPHLTLGRVRSRRSADNGIEEVRQAVPPLLGRMKVERFTLCESRLDPAGTEYRVMTEFPLRGS